MRERHSSIDLLKILSMFMIVVIHLLNQGQAIEYTPYLSANFFIFNLLYIISYVAVNVFGILTGYLMIEATWKVKNYFKLYATVFFYSFVLYLISILFFNEPVSIGLMLNMLFPVTRSIYWYFSSYTALFFLIPFLQIGLRKLDKVQHFMLVVIIVILGTLSTIFNKEPFGLMKGYSPIWLIFLFIIGAYIKKHINIQKINRKVWLICYGIINALLLLSIYVLSFINNRISFRQWFLKYPSPFIVISSIIVVIIFLSYRIKNKRINSLLYKLSVSAFSVYLIHTHKFIFHTFLKGIAKNVPTLSPIYAWVILLFGAVIIYLSCSFIDFCRIKLFNKLKIDLMIDNISDKLSNVYTKLASFLEQKL